MKKSLVAMILPLALVLTAFTARPAGWVFQMTTTVLATGASSVGEMIVVGDRIKMSGMGAEAGAEGDMNFLGDVGEIGELVYNDDENRKFFRMNKQTVEELSSQLGDVQRQMDEAMAGIPEAQRRAIMERAGRGGMPGMPGMAVPVVEVRRTDETATKQGYPCVKYELVVDGRVTQIMWMTEWSNVEGASAAGGTFEKFFGFMTYLREAMPSGPMFGGADAMQGMDFRERFAVVTVMLDRNGEPTQETVLTDVSRREVDLSEIGPKEGYTEERFGPPGR